MNTWILLSTASAVLWSMIILMDKFVLDSEIESSIADAGLHGFFNCATISLIAFLIGSVSFSAWNSFAGLLIALLYSLANYLWFSGAGEEDVSRFAPVLSFDVVFISVLSLVFLQESFSLPIYGGIGLTVAGCFFISLENPVKSLSSMESRKGLILAVGSAFFFAVREIFFKHFTSYIEIWNLMFYFGIAGSLISALMFHISNENMRENTEGIELLGIAGSLSGLALAFFYLAVSKGPVSLVSTITKTRFMLVFLGATTVSRLHPEIMHETMERKVLIQKAVAILMIVTGVGLVSILG